MIKKEEKTVCYITPYMQTLQLFYSTEQNNSTKMGKRLMPT